MLLLKICDVDTLKRNRDRIYNYCSKCLIHIIKFGKLSAHIAFQLHWKRPSLGFPNLANAALERSKTLPATCGPLSFMRTSTDFPLLVFVTLIHVLNPRLRWAAVIAFMSKRSPLAVRFPWHSSPYQEHVPLPEDI